MTTRDQSPLPGEADLLRRARAGDSEALSRLVTCHHGTVYRFLLAFLRDEEQAADATQDTFVKVLERLDSFRGESSFRTWLLVIARNEALGLIRSKGRRKEAPLGEPEHWQDGGLAPDDAAVRAAEVQRVKAALERLPEKQRLTVSLRLFDELSFKEIGEIVDSTEGAARVNYHYGIGRLREWLDPRTA